MPNEKAKNNHPAYSLLRDHLETHTWIWGEMAKSLPQYQYVSRPLYKKLRENNVPPLVAVPATFLAMDFLFHQCFGNLLCLLIHKRMPFHYTKGSGLFSGACSAPVAVYKQFMESPSTKNNP